MKSALSPLDRIRYTYGNESCRKAFLDAAKKDIKKAAELINHEKLRFPTLFLLLSDIDSMGLLPKLCPRNQAAIGFCNRILKDDKDTVEEEAAAEEKAAETGGGLLLQVIKWIFLTGLYDDGLSLEFDQLIDAAAAVLIRTFGDTSILPNLVDLIFRRKRKSGYVHDLVWALFSSREPSVLKLVARYLKTGVKSDAELAKKLLYSAREKSPDENKPKQYTDYISWITENQPYLYFTGESFNQTGEPAPFAVSNDAKYLSRKVAPDTGKIEDTVDENEQAHIEYLHGLSKRDRAILAEFSYRLRMKDKEKWHKWMGLPHERQLEIARRRLGGAR